MSKLAFVFPGQGSQYIGMGQELAREYPLAARHFAEASETLGFELTRLCWEGPEEELKKTANQQPAILTASVACLALLHEAGIKPDMVAGLSLGEYSALVAAGALPFAEAVQLVQRRGTYMQEAVPVGIGGMAAILGLEAKVVDEICSQIRAATGLVVESANYNSPGQVVVSGHVDGVQGAMDLASQAGGKVVKLSVTAPFHSSLLTPAGQMLAGALKEVTLKDAALPVVANVTADYVQRADEIRDLLIRQVSSPVRWEESVRRMIDDGVETFIEVGPSRHLTGFLKKINRNIRSFSIEDVQSLGKVLDSYGRVC